MNNDFFKKDFNKFDDEISSRGIDYLIHFTSTLNLLSIYKIGKIMCRDLLEKIDPEQNDILDYISFTDNYRYDDKKYINLSIQHPNVELLKSFIKKTI